jgi:hypothetical protein
LQLHPARNRTSHELYITQVFNTFRSERSEEAAVS